ncbi:hypothetical protein Tsubulata_016326 [Turnera subulata]|uniref:Transmembrane protein n=1 Tax=Turnera subulata TaxID=218843 RepID=A0A9Q0JJZ4_9ROSI|nr:hypothetical protein Tsubulata_016326 [Turnera subulata]
MRETVVVRERERERERERRESNVGSVGLFLGRFFCQVVEDYDIGDKKKWWRGVIGWLACCLLLLLLLLLFFLQIFVNEVSSISSSTEYFWFVGAIKVGKRRRGLSCGIQL